MTEKTKIEKTLLDLINYAERVTCMHEETHRGGSIWEICDQCGARWADDEGGKPEYKEPKEIEAARCHLQTLKSGVRPHEDAPIADAGDNVKTNYELFDAVVSKVPFLVGRMIGQSDENERRLTSHEINALLLPVAHYLSALANNSIPVWQPIETAPDGKQLDPDWYRTDSQKLEIWKEIAQERQELIESLWKEGHKLVPIDPTPEQLCAAEKAWQERMKTRAREGTLLSPPKDTHASFRETYKAMLAAAPQLREDR